MTFALLCSLEHQASQRLCLLLISRAAHWHSCKNQGRKAPCMHNQEFIEIDAPNILAKMAMPVPNTKKKASDMCAVSNLAWSFSDLVWEAIIQLYIRYDLGLAQEHWCTASFKRLSRHSKSAEEQGRLNATYYLPQEMQAGKTSKGKKIEEAILLAADHVAVGYQRSLIVRKALKCGMSEEELIEKKIVPNLKFVFKNAYSADVLTCGSWLSIRRSQIEYWLYWPADLLWLHENLPQVWSCSTKSYTKVAAMGRNPCVCVACRLVACCQIK